MQTRWPAGVPLDDLDVGARYDFQLRGGPKLSGLFVRMLLERGRGPRVTFSLAGGREKIVWIDDLESIEKADEPSETTGQFGGSEHSDV